MHPGHQTNTSVKLISCIEEDTQNLCHLQCNIKFDLNYLNFKTLSRDVRAFRNGAKCVCFLYKLQELSAHLYEAMEGVIKTHLCLIDMESPRSICLLLLRPDNDGFVVNTQTFILLFPQAPVYVCNKGSAWSNMRVSAGAGQKSRTDSPASSWGREDDSGGVWTLPHEDNQLGRESQIRLCLHQLLGRGL